MNKKSFLDILKKAEAYIVEYAEIEETVNNEFVKNLRKKLNMSQNVFSSVLGVTKKTIEKWEQGVNPIKGCSARLLFLLNKKPDLINEIYKINMVNRKEDIVYSIEIKEHSNEEISASFFKNVNECEAQYIVDKAGAKIINLNDYNLGGPYEC